MLLFKKDTKLNPAVSLFDVQTELTSRNKFDLPLATTGRLSRIIGIDKLRQHLLKFIFVRKGTYLNNRIGTSLNILGSKSDNTIKSDIINTFQEYSDFQKENSNLATNVIGWDIYRTETPDVTASWKKLNRHLITNNFYYDSNLLVNRNYFYSVVKVKTVNNKPVSDNISNIISVLIPNTDTLNTIVASDFILTPKRKAVTLYWTKDVNYQDEEILRGLSQFVVQRATYDPRQLLINLQFTNKQQNQATITVNKEQF